MTAVAMGDQSSEALSLVEAEPGIDRVGIAGLEQAVTRDGVRRVSSSDLEQGGAAFADVRS
jgi:hypothetical protein